MFFYCFYKCLILYDIINKNKEKIWQLLVASGVSLPFFWFLKASLSNGKMKLNSGGKICLRGRVLNQIFFRFIFSPNGKKNALKNKLHPGTIEP